MDTYTYRCPWPGIGKIPVFWLEKTTPTYSPSQLMLVNTVCLCYSTNQTEIKLTHTEKQTAKHAYILNQP